MKLNLAPIRRIVQELTMNDECLITSDPEGTGDDVWDEETGTYVKPVNDRVTIYEGPCSVYPFSIVIQEGERGEEEIMESRYWLGVPMDAEIEPPPESLCEITAVDPDQGDPALVDRVFVIDEQEFQTLASSRRFKMRILTAKP